MSIVSLLILIGIVTSIVSSFKESAKKADNKTREKRNASKGGILNKIPFEKLETYVSEDIVNEFKGYVGYQEKTKVDNSYNKNASGETLHKKSTRKKKKKVDKKVDKFYVNEKNTVINTINITPKKKRRRKNPFEFTENPVTNAIIASEILGKPKCKK